MRIFLPLFLALTACTGTSSGPAATEAEPEADPLTMTAYRRWGEAGADERPVPAGPNVVLVVLCTWRADQLGPWGGSTEAAPTMGELAQAGVVFDTAIAQAPWTRPASTAILTGQFPDDVGMTEPEGGPSRRALGPEVTTLPERMHQAGWSTIGVTANPNLNAIWGFDQGFDAYIEAVLAGQEGTLTGPSGGQRVVKAALEEVSARPERRRPLFLQLVLVDAHAPVHPQPAEVARFAEPGLPDEVARYRAGLRRADKAVSDLLSGLDQAGVDRSNTLVVLVGDHGEGLSMPPSHGPHHGLMLYPSTVHVPLVMSGPGVGTGRIGGLTTQLDVVPTVLGLTGQPVPAGLAGEDLSSAVRAGQGRASRDAAFTSTRFRWADRSAVLTDTVHCQIDHNSKGTHQRISQGHILPFSNGCCHYTQDPGCDTPQWDQPLMERLEAWRADRDKAASAITPIKAEPNQVLREQLRALGYVE